VRGQNNVQERVTWAFCPTCSPAIRTTDPAVRQKFADAWGIDVNKMDDRVGTRITEVPHLALEGKVKAYYIMGKIRFRPKPIWAWYAAV
jgi:formate dehydrogenase major subunit